MTDFVLAVHSNWEGLYADGELVEENHANRVSVGDHMVGHTVESYQELALPTPPEMASYPQHIEDIPGYESTDG